MAAWQSFWQSWNEEEDMYPQKNACPHILQKIGPAKKVTARI